MVKAVGALLQSVFRLFFYGTKFNDIFPVGFEGIKSPAALVKIGIYVLHLLFHFCGGDTARTLQNGFLLELQQAIHIAAPIVYSQVAAFLDTHFRRLKKNGNQPVE